jgi:hypothetical protein
LRELFDEFVRVLSPNIPSSGSTTASSSGDALTAVMIGMSVSLVKADIQLLYQPITIQFVILNF